MQSWAINKQTTDRELESVFLEDGSVEDSQLERISGVVQSIVASTSSTASVSDSGAHVSTSQEFDVFVKCDDGIERHCRPTDRVLVSVGHRISAVNLKIRTDPPILLFLASHTTRHEYRPRLRTHSLLWILFWAPLLLAGILMAIVAFLLPNSWSEWIKHSNVAGALLLFGWAYASIWFVKNFYQFGQENRKHVEQLIASFADEEKARQQTQ